VSKAIIDNNHQFSFLTEVGKAKTRVLLLDYDGTIAPFCADRRRALPYAGIPDLLRVIMTSCATRLIVVSGRAAHELPPLLGLNPLPEIWGTYGVERIRIGGRYEQIECTDDAVEVLALAESELDRHGLCEHLEVKLAGVAVHWRGLAPSKVLTIRTKAYRILEPLAAQQPHLVLSEFEEGVEIRIRSANKGNVLRNFISELDADVPIAYMGDDATDEEAFRVLNGRGLTVLVRPQHRFTAAQIWVRPPDELTQFLKDWIRVCKRGVR
jgi:trehalose 6-phosphate phosphatase